MKWNKTSEQKPEIGTFCLCKKRNVCECDFDVARYGDGDDNCWVVFGPGVWDCAFREVNYYDYWMSLSELDEEARHEVE